MNEKLKPVQLAYDALCDVTDYRNTHVKEWMILKESFASCAIENNELASELLSTVDRLEKCETVGDRWILQLAYYLQKQEIKRLKQIHDNAVCPNCTLAKEYIYELQAKLEKEKTND